jgi:tetratricopeptide (TPR) repeat protein
MSSLFDEHLERGNAALDRRDYHEADEAFEAALAAASVPYERALALDGAADVCFRREQNDRALAMLEEAVALCLPKPVDSAPMDGKTAYALALACFDQGTMLAALGRDEESVAALDRSLAQLLDQASALGGEDRVGTLRLIVKTLDQKALTLSGPLGRNRDALACYENLVRRFQNSQDIKVMERVARAMLRCANIRGRLGRQDEEIAGCDAVVARYGAIGSPQLAQTVLDALEWKLLSYRDQGDYEQVIPIADDIIQRFASALDRELVSGVARNMIRKAGALHQLGRLAEELECYDEVALRYGERPEPWLRAHAVHALMFKAITLNDSGQTADEMECYEQIIARYAEDADDKVRSVAAQALVNKGLSLGAIADDAAEDTGVREIEAEIACYDEAIARYGEADFVGLQQAVAEALLHKGTTLLEAGRSDEAAACFNALIDGYDHIEDAELEKIVMEARELRAEI